MAKSGITAQWIERILQGKNDPILRSFLKDVALVRSESGYTLFVPSQTILTYLRHRYYALLVQTLESMESAPIHLDMEVREMDRSASQLELFERPEPEDDIPVLRLNMRYTFENFVKGENNQMTYAAAIAVAESPGTVYNPLFIYGGTGQGKTHLLNAIGNYVVLHHPRLRVVYFTADGFTNDFITALQSNKVNEFRKKYARADVLLMDDIQFLAKKAETQKALFHLINLLNEDRRQIVLTSDSPPRDLKDIEDRLVSRFASGLVTDIQPPDYETRVAILRQKVQDFPSVQPAEEILHFIAAHFTNNVRELEGALTRVISYATYMKRPLDLLTAQDALKGLVPMAERPIDVMTLIEVIAEHFGLTASDLLSKRRTQEVALARQIAMFIARALSRLSLAEIGKALGGRDHTTVLHGISKVEQLLKESPDLARQVESLMDRIKASH
ncbi:MAG: chromosomal replication initiator protein DnaA [bacterium JZ-2024 1]